MVVKYEDFMEIGVTEITDVEYRGPAYYDDEKKDANDEDKCLVIFTPVCSSIKPIALSTSRADALAIIDELYINGKVDVTDYDTDYMNDEMCAALAAGDIDAVLNKLSYWSKLSKAAE